MAPSPNVQGAGTPCWSSIMSAMTARMNSSASGDQPPGTLPRSLANTMAALVADPSAPVTFTAQLALHYAFVASKPYAVVVSCAGWGWLVCRAAACARARASELCHACLPE